MWVPNSFVVHSLQFIAFNMSSRMLNKTDVAE